MKKSRLDDLLRRNKKHLALDLVITAALLIGLSISGLVAAVEVGKMTPDKVAQSAPLVVDSRAGTAAHDNRCDLHPLGVVAIQ